MDRTADDTADSSNRDREVSPARGLERLRLIEWVAAFGATAVLVGLHVTLLVSAGGLWRDEVDCVNFASLPSLGEARAHLQFQSFPILWSAVLRAWLKTGAGSTDFGIRILGFLIGVGVLAALWRNARAFRSSVPLVSLALLGFNSAVIGYGDSIRGYGLGMLTGLLTFGLIWEAADAPSPKRAVLAALSAVLAVHCLYYNVVFVFAACLAGAAVALSRKSWRTAGLIVSIGAVSALTLLPYTRTIEQARQWNDLIRTDVSAAWVSLKLQEAFATTGRAIHWLWIALAALAAIAALRAWIRSGSVEASSRERDAALYCGVALLTGVPGYFLFLKALSYYTQPWYFVALMALVAACLDLPLALLFRSVRARIVRLVMLSAVVALVVDPVWTTVRTRRTNLDLVASRVRQLTAGGDLIVVNPWYLGITFDRYYGGNARRTTIPPVADLSVHRYDIVKQAMMSARAIDPLRMEIERTLREGHRVFWVGDLFIPQDGEVPEDPPPAPHPVSGWSDGPYYYAWGLQAGYLIKTHATAGEGIEIPLRQAVNPYEEAALYVFSGWGEPEPASAR